MTGYWTWKKGAWFADLINYFPMSLHWQQAGQEKSCEGQQMGCWGKEFTCYKLQQLKQMLICIMCVHAGKLHRGQ